MSDRASLYLIDLVDTLVKMHLHGFGHAHATTDSPDSQSISASQPRRFYPHIDPVPTSRQEQEATLNKLLDLGFMAYYRRDPVQTSSSDYEKDFLALAIDWIQKTGGLPNVDEDIRSNYPGWLLVRLQAMLEILPTALDRAEAFMAEFDRMSAARFDGSAGSS